MSCCDGQTVTKREGSLESGRVAQLIEDSRRCAVNAAIRKARATVCCPAPPRPNTNVQLESALLQARVAQCTQITAADATAIARQSLRGVPESVRIRQRQQDVQDEFAPYNNPSRRFLEYQGPIVIPPCPEIPTEDSNANIAKAPKSCTALELINTGRP